MQGRLLLAAVDALAERAGLGPGLPLAEARALVPGLATAPRDPDAEARALARLGAWCGRYTPWVAPGGGGVEFGGGAGLLLDVTGCAHLFAETEAAGEAALLADLVARLARRGLSARAALAETPGAAWAVARFAAPPPGARDGRWAVVPPGGLRAALAPLPPAALRLPAATVELLARLGLRRIAALFDLPQAALEPRFGPEVARRLAQALGHAAEPISPRRPVPAQLARCIFAEPIVAPEDIARALARLLGVLCRKLERADLGARRLVLTTYRVDGSARPLSLGTSRPTRDPAHLERLFAAHLERIDPGFGIEAMSLGATATEGLSALQLAFAEHGSSPNPGGGPEVANLIDRLGGRLGLDRVQRLAPRASYLPERALAAVPALEEAAAAWRGRARAPVRQPRPLRLLPRPEPVEAVALLPDHPPARFRWRRLSHRVARAEGPERIAPEWWLADAQRAGEPARDYFRVEVEDGRRYWLYRADGRWFLHGIFG